MNMKTLPKLRLLAILFLLFASLRTEAVATVQPGQSLDSIASPNAIPPPPDNANAVPETASTWGLMLLGLTSVFGLMLVLRRRQG